MSLRQRASRSVLALYTFGLSSVPSLLSQHAVVPSSVLLNQVIARVKTEQYALMVANRVDKMTPLAAEGFEEVPKPQSNIRLVERMVLGNTAYNTMSGEAMVVTEQLTKAFGFVSRDRRRGVILHAIWNAQRSAMPGMMDNSYDCTILFQEIHSDNVVDKLKRIMDASFGIELNTLVSKNRGTTESLEDVQFEILIEASDSSAFIHPNLKSVLDIVANDSNKESMEDAKWCFSFASSFPSMIGFNQIHALISEKL